MYGCFGAWTTVSAGAFSASFPAYMTRIESAILHVLDPSSLHDDEDAAERAIGLFQVVTGLVLLVGLLFTFVADLRPFLRGGVQVLSDSVVGPTLQETRERIREWNDLGKSLCDAFVIVAERVDTPA